MREDDERQRAAHLGGGGDAHAELGPPLGRGEDDRAHRQHGGRCGHESPSSAKARTTDGSCFMRATYAGSGAGTSSWNIAAQVSMTKR